MQIYLESEKWVQKMLLVPVNSLLEDQEFLVLLPTLFSKSLVAGSSRHLKITRKDMAPDNNYVYRCSVYRCNLVIRLSVTHT